MPLTPCLPRQLSNDPRPLPCRHTGFELQVKHAAPVLPPDHVVKPPTAARLARAHQAAPCNSSVLHALPQGAAISADELADYPPVFRDTGSSRVTRVQDILLFLQSPQMEVDRYRVSAAPALPALVSSKAAG